jgi:hypothetical protein
MIKKAKAKQQRIAIGSAIHKTAQVQRRIERLP